MNVTYEVLAQVAQQGGLIYFSAIFVAGSVYAFWPKNREKFERAARAPLDEEPHP